jgi:CubicO group peptidase (beta-lactamase class C family)
MNQTSGLSDSAFEEMSEKQPQTLEQAVKRLSDARIANSPGTSWNYHNPNYHVLARLVEVVSGRPFADYLQVEIFKPIGMTHTSTVLQSRQSTMGIVDGYVSFYSLMIPRSIPAHFIAGSGGVISTARDMGKWLTLNLNDGVTTDGRRLISGDSLRLMHRRTGGVAGDYGFGWDTDDLPGGIRRVKHGGLLFTFSAYQALYPSLDYGVVALFNSVGTTGAEQASVIDGLDDFVLGDRPQLGTPVESIVAAVFALLTLIAAIIGIWNIRRSRHWASRWAHRRRTFAVVRLLVGLIPVALFLSLPTLVSQLYGGRDVTWATTLFALPPLIILFAVSAIFALWVFALRVKDLRQQWRGRTAQPEAQ